LAKSLKNMILGFTGTQTLRNGEKAYVDACLEDLFLRLQPDTIVTGGCIGIDVYVHHWFYINHPHIKRIVTLPYDKKKVDMSVCDTADIVHDSRVTYRARNEHIVELSDTVAAFWTGKKMYSGTFMTMNIANRANKLIPENIFGMNLLSSSEARKMYFLS